MHNNITMSENKLELKVIKDSDDSDIDLNNLSLDAAKSFLILFDSLTKIVELTPNNEGVTLQIISGSAVAVANGTASQIESVETCFDEIVNHVSTDKEIVSKWRAIQELVCKNGLQYEINIYKDSEKRPIFQTIKSAKQFRVKSNRIRPDITLKFLTGKLIEVGGKKPNIHLLDLDNNRFTINCDHANAKRANKYLYSDINVSVWFKNKEGSRAKYDFCDVYHSNEVYNDFSEFMIDYYNDFDEISALKKLHYKCKFFIDNNDFIHLNKFIRLFNHDANDLNELKTILVITKAFKEQEHIKLIRERIKFLFDQKLLIHHLNNLISF